MEARLDLLLLWTLTLAAANSQRTFLPVAPANISCSSANSEVLKCNNTDCFIVEVRSSSVARDNTVSVEEWRRMSQAMQELAREDRLDDEYPATDIMAVFPPLSGLRQRFCPVEYLPVVNTDQVPALIMHAKCCGNCPKLPPNSLHACKEVKQYRQVYQLAPSGCRLNNNSKLREGLSAGETIGGLYVKTFVEVSVNCAAFLKV